MTGDEDDVRAMVSMPPGAGDDRGGMSVAGKVLVGFLVTALLAVIGVVAYVVVGLYSMADPGPYYHPTSTPMREHPTLEEFHAELWPLGHEFMRQLEAETGVTFVLEPGFAGVTKCNLDQGWMEDSAHYAVASIDPAVAERVGVQVLSYRFSTHSVDDHAASVTVLYWGNPDGSSLSMTIWARGNGFVRWSSGCALSSVYPPPNQATTWPTPLPDPEAPTVTASPLPSSPAARPTPMSSPS